MNRRNQTDGFNTSDPKCGNHSRYVTDEMVETAARAYHEAVPEAVAGSWDVSTPRIHERGRARARAALEAVAPLIAAAALRDAADAAFLDLDLDDALVTEWEAGYADGISDSLSLIRDYADMLEADRG